MKNIYHVTQNSNKMCISLSIYSVFFLLKIIFYNRKKRELSQSGPTIRIIGLEIENFEVYRKKGKRK
jgi:hypothetical protein